jgi:glycogen operon protein
MLLAGDEVGRTQFGNNNTYCQDNELSWFDWDLVESNAELLRFTRHLIAFRRTHPVLREATHPLGVDFSGVGLPDVSWHGVRPWQPDWSPGSRLLAVMRCGRVAAGAKDHVYVAMNSHWEGHDLELPELTGGAVWRVFADTGAPAPHDVHEPGDEPVPGHPRRYHIGPRCVVILTGSV